MNTAVAEEQAPALPVAIPRDAYLLSTALFLIIAATNILTPLLPDIRNDFGVSIATAGIIVGAYGLARLIVDLPAGFLADRIGHRRLSAVALVVLVASCLLGLGATTVELLIAARVGMGASVAILATVILSSLSATATAVNRGKVMSLFHVANNTGIALYPLVGGVVGAWLGWRATFGVTAVLSIAGLAVATPGGMLGDRIGRRRVITSGLAAIAAGDLVFLLTHDLVTFLAAAALIGFGDFFSSSQTALLSEIVPPAQRTRTLGGYRFSADLGAFVGPVLLAAVMDVASAQAAILVAVAVLLASSAAARFGVPARADL